MTRREVTRFGGLKEGKGRKLACADRDGRRWGGLFQKFRAWAVNKYLPWIPLGWIGLDRVEKRVAECLYEERGVYKTTV